MKKLLSVLLVVVMLLTCLPLDSIPVLAEEASEAPNAISETDSVYYTDLFYAYSYYLAADDYLAQYAADIENVYNSVYESYRNSPLVIGTGLEHALDTITSPTSIATLLTDAMGVTRFSYYDALDAANEEFLKNILSNSSIYTAKEEIAAYGDSCGKFKKGFSILNNLEGEQIPGEPSTVDSLVQDGFTLLYEAGVFNHISAIDINAICNEINAQGFSLGECFELAQTEYEIAEAILYCAMLEDTRLSVVDDIIATQTSDTVLKEGMTRLRRQIQADFTVRFVNSYLVNHVADKVLGAIDKAAVSTFGTAQLNAIFSLTKFAFNQAVDVPKFADVLKWQVLMCYSRDLAAGLPNYALKYANGPFLSNEILKYENLFAAFDAVNTATLSVARDIEAMGDPFGDAFLVLTEACRMGEETVTIKSGFLSVDIPSNMSSEEFYDIMRLGVWLDSTGATHSFGSEVSVSNSETTVEIPRKANTLFSIFRKGVSANMLMIDTFSYTDAYTTHIARVKSTVQSIPVNERITISKDVYSKWTYTVNKLVQLRHGSDAVESNCVYAVNGILLGNVKLTSAIESPAPAITVDGNITMAAKGIEILGDLTATGTLSIPDDTSLVIHDSVEANVVSGGWRTNLKVYGDLLCNNFGGLANTEVFGTVCATEDFSIPYWAKATLSGNVTVNTFSYGYDAVVDVYGSVTCNNFDALGIGTIYGDVTVRQDISIDHLLTVAESGLLTAGGNASTVLFGDFVNKGHVEIEGSFKPGYGSLTDNYGELIIGETLTMGTKAELNNWGIIRVHDVKCENNDSWYKAKVEDATLYISGDIEWWPRSFGGITVFNGTEKQTTNIISYSTVVIENTSAEGVIFDVAGGYRFKVKTLLNHHNNNFTMNAYDASFPDYDGDGMKDNVDPEPTVGNPCSLQFQSGNTEQGTVSLGTVEIVGGTTISVVATPTNKYEFLYWVDEAGKVVSTSATWKLVARGDATYTAVFQKRSQPITATTEGGTIIVPEKAEIDSTVTVGVKENDGFIYQEGSLTYNSIPVINNSFIMPDEPVELTATFIRNEHFFALVEALDIAKSYSHEPYTTASFAELTQTISAAESALYNHITAEESQEQILLLQQAIDELVDRSVVSIEVLKMPKFYVNIQETINDLTLRITYDNGLATDVSASECSVSDFDSSIVGKQTVRLNYEGVEKLIEIDVALRDINDCTGLQTIDLLFDGQTLEYVQSFVLNYTLTKETLAEGVDYKVTYVNNAAVGNATVTIEGVGIYSGSVELTYRIYCEHVYDNACDGACNICQGQRTPSEHVYDAICDKYCNECGFVREAESHDYNRGNSFACFNCGMTKTSLLSVSNFEDAQLHNLNIGQETTIDEDAARTGVFGLHLRGDGGWSGLANHYVDTVVGRKYELSFWVKVNSENGANLQIRDSINGVNIMNKYYGKNCSSWTCIEFSFVAASAQTQIVFSGSGSGELEDVYLDDICLMSPVFFGSKTSISEDVNGLAFKFDVAAIDGRVVNSTEYVKDSAKIVPGVDGQEYSLVRMGAVISNKSDAMLDLDSVNGKTIIDIPAVYLCELGEGSLSYAVRVINIPVSGMNTKIHVQPYYVYEKDGKEIVIYGNIVSKSYSEAYTYNGDFETGDMSGWNCNSGNAAIVTDAHSGQYALELTNPTAWGEAATRTFSVKPNTRYEVSWYAKRVSGTGAFNLFATQATSPYSAFTQLYGQNWMSETSGEWVKYSCVYSTDENAQMQLKFTAETDSAGSIIIDDVVVSEWYPAAKSTFEDGDINGWKNGNNALSIVKEAGGSGEYSLQFDASYASFAIAYKSIFIDANADCKISFKMKSNLTYPVSVGFLSSGWQSICSVQVVPTTDWAEYTVTLNPGDNSKVMLILQSYVTDSAGQVFWFDDISYAPC